jgi:hypothetical protein
MLNQIYSGIWKPHGIRIQSISFFIGSEGKFYFTFFFNSMPTKLENLIFHVMSKCPSLSPPSSILNILQSFMMVFCRGENGELRLGIRRAVRPRNGLPDSIVGNENSYPKVFSLVANAISAKSMFHVFYSPRYLLAIIS